MLPRGAAKAHDLHLGANELPAIREDDLSSSRAGERVSGSVLTRLLLPLSQRSQPRRPVAQRQLSFAPRSRARRIVVAWNPSVGHFQSAETSCPRPPTGIRPASNDPPKPLPRKRLSGLSPGIGSPHSTRRGLPGEETFSRTQLGLPTKGDSNFSNNRCNRRQRLWTIGAETVCVAPVDLDQELASPLTGMECALNPSHTDIDWRPESDQRSHTRRSIFSGSVFVTLPSAKTTAYPSCDRGRSGNSSGPPASGLPAAHSKKRTVRAGSVMSATRTPPSFAFIAKARPSSIANGDTSNCSIMTP